MVMDRALLDFGNGVCFGALPTACFAQYPRGGYGISSRSQILARPLPLIPYSSANRDIGVVHTAL